MDLQGLPGYDVAGPRDPSGQTWRARQQANGRAVLLLAVPLPPDPAARDAVRRAAARVGGLSSPYLLPLHTVVTTAEGLVLVHDYPAGGTLTSLLAARQSLAAGEVVTLGLALAGALAEVHGAGLAHGALEEDSVHLGLDGTPLLAGVGLSGGSARADGDVRALAALCQRALGAGADGAGGGATAPVRKALTALAKRADVDLAALSAALRTAPAVAIRLAGPEVDGDESSRPAVVSDGRRSDGRRSEGRPASGSVSLRDRIGVVPAAPRRRVVAMVGAAIAVLFAAAMAGIAWGHRSGGPTAVPLPARSLPTGRLPSALASASASGPSAAALGAASSTPSTRRTSAPRSASTLRSGPSWRAVLTGLDRQRAAALSAADASGPARFDAPGSTALRRDAAVIMELRRRGAHARGLRWDVVDVTVDSAGPPGVTLRVTDRMTAYDLLDAGGRRLASRPARGEAVWRVTLVPGKHGWQVTEVAAA